MDLLCGDWFAFAAGDLDADVFLVEAIEAGVCPVCFATGACCFVAALDELTGTGLGEF